MSGRRGPHIENEAAYEAAISARIQANARKTNRVKWFAEHEDAQRLWDFLFWEGEFNQEQYEDDPRHPGGYRRVRARISRATGKGFGELLDKFAADLEQWGKLSPKQTEIVRNALVKAEGFANERDAQRASKAATIGHVGTVGERRDFDLTVKKVLAFEGTFGATYVNICEDGNGNVVVYKGSNDWPTGPIKVKATVKDHDVRNGLPQTLISRPKVI